MDGHAGTSTENKILELISSGSWEEALSEFSAQLGTGELSETMSILGATIMEHFGALDSMYELVIKGLGRNPENYELYVLLGDYFRESNPDLAYLTYENAAYICGRSTGADFESDLEQIRSIMSQLRCDYTISVRTVSFVILSYNTLEYTQVCIESIRNTCPADTYEIIVVDNNSDDGSVEWLRTQKDIILIENDHNTGFPAGCNQGIKAACPDNDILLLNNDTKLLFNSFYMLRLGLYSDPLYGASGAVTNYAGNHQVLEYKWNTLNDFDVLARKNNIPNRDKYEFKNMLVMFAMLIRRNVIDEVGELDERYTPGYYEDDDYGHRITERGYKCVLCWNCFILHFGSRSFAKTPDKYYELMKVNREKFYDKWGFYPGEDK